MASAAKMTIVDTPNSIFQYIILFNHAKTSHFEGENISQKIYLPENCIENEIIHEIDARTKKKGVQFADKPRIKIFHKWIYAYRQARTDKWQQMARDRARFKRKIDELDKIISPILLKRKIC